ncbi:MAG TPA: cyclic nucleotide-binding domain-containing protein [Methylophilaceae bacterium]
MDEILAMAKDIELFNTLSIDEVTMLCSHMRCYGAPRNYSLLEEGEETDNLLLILTGWVELKQAISNTGLQGYKEVVAGAMVGEMSLIDGQPQPASCTTAVPTDFAVLTREELNRILVRSPKLANKLLIALLRRMCSHLREAEQAFYPGTLQ